MVHLDKEVVAEYLRDSMRVLQPGGMALFHHSNAGFPQAAGKGGRKPMSRDLFATLAQDAGLEVVEQVAVAFGDAPELDCATLVRKPKPDTARAVATADAWMSSRPWIDLPNPPIAAYVSGLPRKPDFDLEAKLKEWHERGLVIFEQAVPIELIDALERDLEYLKNHHMEYTLDVELKSKSRDIKEYSREQLDSQGIKFNHLHSISRNAALVSLAAPVMQFLTHVFRSPPCVMQSLTFHLGSQQPAHIDYPYVREQNHLAHLTASWTALEDIHPDSGPLAYYPGSHRPEVSGFFDWGGGSILMEKDSTNTPMQFAHFLWDRMRSQGVQPEIFCPKKGDVLIWHGNLVHEGTKIKQEGLTRKSYVTHFSSLAAYPLRQRKPKALESGAYISANGGYVFDWPWLDGVPRLPGWKS
jgi:phytanoyl-CoA hydroxylase